MDFFYKMKLEFDYTTEKFHNYENQFHYTFQKLLDESMKRKGHNNKSSRTPGTTYQADGKQEENEKEKEENEKEKEENEKEKQEEEKQKQEEEKQKQEEEKQKQEEWTQDSDNTTTSQSPEDQASNTLCDNVSNTSPVVQSDGTALGFSETFRSSQSSKSTSDQVPPSSSRRYRKKLCKKLYRKISLKSHPDKYPNRHEIFIRAKKAYQQLDLMELLFIALLVKIRQPYVSVKEYEQMANMIKCHLDKIRHNLVWVWFEQTHQRVSLRKYLAQQWRVSIQEIIKFEQCKSFE